MLNHQNWVREERTGRAAILCGPAAKSEAFLHQLESTVKKYSIYVVGNGVRFRNSMLLRSLVPLGIAAGLADKHLGAATLIVILWGITTIAYTFYRVFTDPVPP